MKLNFIFISLFVILSNYFLPFGEGGWGCSYAQTVNSSAHESALKSGNSRELSKYFNTTVNLKILNQESIYSKADAEKIVKDFFTKNPPKSYLAKHNGTSKNGAHYFISQITTANGVFRTYCLLKKSENAVLIHELKIELEE